MTALDLYSDPSALPGSEAGRIGMLLGLKAPQQIDDIDLAERVSERVARGLCGIPGQSSGADACCRLPDSGSNAEACKKEPKSPLSRDERATL